MGAFPIPMLGFQPHSSKDSTGGVCSFPMDTKMYILDHPCHIVPDRVRIGRAGDVGAAEFVCDAARSIYKGTETVRVKVDRYIRSSGSLSSVAGHENE